MRTSIIFLIAFTAFLFPDNKSKDQNPIATIVLEDESEIVIELYPEKAPNTVNNSIYLAKNGFYNGLSSTE